MTHGVIGNTSDFGSAESWFEPRWVNKKSECGSPEKHKSIFCVFRGSSKIEDFRDGSEPTHSFSRSHSDTHTIRKDKRIISLGRIGSCPGCLPTAETYKTYLVAVWTPDGGRKIIQINPAMDGSYKTDLEPGKDLIMPETDINNIGSSNLPVEIIIISDYITTLNIDIDTGIR